MNLTRQEKQDLDHLQLSEQNSHLSYDQFSNKASEHKESYLNFMKTVVSIPKQELRSILQRRFFKYSEQTYQQSFRIQAKSYIHNLEVIDITVSYAYFTGGLTILNVDAESSIHSGCKSSSGGYGHIYKIVYEGKEYALKCLSFIENNFQIIFSDAIVEYFLLKISSILEVGPSMNAPFGFDLIIYRNCIEFAMEFCKYCPSQYLDRDLKVALHKLHSLRFIHYDIKPQNINYSQTYGRFVFIDFGLSKIIKQDLGQKTQTLFRGSLIYCSREMETAYFESKSKIVDLYYNDVECLRKSLAYFHQCLQLYEIDNQQSENQIEMTGKYDLMALKYKIYKASQEIKHQNNISQIMNDPLIDKYIIQLIEFISYLPSGDEIFLQFYDKFWRKADRQQRYAKQNKQFSRQEEQTHESQINMFTVRFDNFRSLSSQSINYRNPVKYYDWQRKLIFDIEMARHSTKEIYYLKVLDAIRVEGNDFPMSLKVKVAEYFLKFQIKLKDQKICPIKATLLFLLRYYFTSPVNKYSIMILQNLLNSLFFFQTVTQEEAITLFEAFLKIQCQLVGKLRLIFKFITTIKWVEEKYISIYDYYLLENAMWIRAKIFLQSLSATIMCKLQQIYYNILVSIIQQPLGRTTFTKIQKIIGTHKYQTVISLNHSFLHQLYQYITLRELQFYIQNSVRLPACTSQRILKMADDQGKKCGLSICLFSKFHISNYKLKKDRQFEFYLRGIQIIVSNYPQIKHYSIFIYYHLHRLSREQQNVEVMKNLIELGFNEQSYLIKLEFFTEVLKIFLIKVRQTENDKVVIELSFLQFASITIQQLIVLPQSLPSYLRHRHQLVSIVQKMILVFNFAINLRIAEINVLISWMNVFVSNLLILVEKSQCINCKWKSLMDLCHIWFYIQFLKGDFTKALKILVDFATYYIKIDFYVLGSISNLIDFVGDIYNCQHIRQVLVSLFFEIVKIWNHYEFFFQSEYHGKQRLIDVYTYLLDKNLENQLIKIVQFSVLFIPTHSVKNYVFTFYNAIYSIIEVLPQNAKTYDFYESHAGIIAHFKAKQFHPYIGFYFFILQLSNFRKGYNTDIMYYIAKSINLLSYWCRLIVKSNYYGLFLFHFGSSQRKQKYLNQQRYKYWLKEKPSFHQFINNHQKKNKARAINFINLKKMEHSLKKYYQNIFMFDEKSDQF